jgi:hypothetical protein
MRSRTSERFRKAFDALPQSIQHKTREAYARWSANPAHPSLRFKKIHDTLPIFSVRIDRDWRAVGILENDEVVWFWIGSHADYDDLVSRLRKR